MDELNLKALEQIPIPEGLEGRLSARIDEWERQEKKPSCTILLPKALRYAAVAASIVLIFSVGFHLLNQGNNTNLAEQDTYQNPVQAKQEAVRALNLLATNLNKGVRHLEKVKALGDKTEQSLHKHLNIFN